MAAIEQGGTLTTNNDVLVRATPSGPLVDPDSDTLILTVKNPDGTTFATIPQASLTRLAQGHYSYPWTVPALTPTGDYPWNWNARVNAVQLPTAVEDVVVVLAGSLSTGHLVPTADVRVLVPTGLTDDQLATVIGRAESLLASEIGTLAGARTEVFTIVSGETRRWVRLRRVTTAATITTDSTVSTDFRIGSDGRTIVPLQATGWARGYWTGVMEATYTPADLDLVMGAVIDIVRGVLTDGPYASESIGDYSYTRGDTGGRAPSHVRSIARRYGLLPKADPSSPRLLVSEPGWIGTARPS